MLVCCTRCRLIQVETASCADCGELGLVPVADIEALGPAGRGITVRQKNVRFGHAVHESRRALPGPTAGPHRGRAQTIDGPRHAPISGAEVLAAATEIVSPSGDLFCRRRTLCDFWLVGASGEPTLVAGELCVHAPRYLGRPPEPPEVVAEREHLQALGLPTDILLQGTAWVWEWSIRPGNDVEAFGEPRSELVAGLAYREEEIPVLRGRSGAPIHLRAVIASA